MGLVPSVCIVGAAAAGKKSLACFLEGKAIPQQYNPSPTWTEKSIYVGKLVANVRREPYATMAHWKYTYNVVILVVNCKRIPTSVGALLEWKEQSVVLAQCARECAGHVILFANNADTMDMQGTLLNSTPSVLTEAEVKVVVVGFRSFRSFVIRTS